MIGMPMHDGTILTMDFARMRMQVTRKTKAGVELLCPALNDEDIVDALARLYDGNPLVGDAGFCEGDDSEGEREREFLEMGRRAWEDDDEPAR